MADFTMEAGFVSDGSEDRVADDFERQMTEGFRKLALELRRAMEQALRATGKQTKDPLGLERELTQVRKLLRDVDRDVDGLSERSRGLGRALAGSGFEDTVKAHTQALRDQGRVAQLVDKDLEKLANDPARRRAYALDAESFDNATKRMLQDARNAKDLIVAEKRSQTALSVAETRRQMSAEARASGERVATIQAEGSRVTAETRSAAQRRVAIIQAAARQIEAAERGIAAVFRNTIAAAQAVGRGFGSAFRGVAGVFQRMRRTATTENRAVERSLERVNREMSSGFGPALSRRESLLRSSFRRQESAVASSVTRQSEQLQRLETRMSSGLAGAISGRSAAAATLGIGGLVGGGMALRRLFTSGWERFSALERINKQLTVMLGSAEQAQVMLAGITEAAQGTAFALNDMADLSVGFLSMGVAAEKVVPYTEAIADAVAFTGGGAEQMQRIGLAMRQIASTGKLQGDEFNQLAENLAGLNINQLLADQLTGGDTAALLAMRESGDLTAEMFTTAFIAGLESDPRTEGAAKRMGELLSGQFANLQNAVSRLGAAIITKLAGPLSFFATNAYAALGFLSTFIAGGEGLGPALNIVRDAAIGAGAALTGLLVAKAVGEAIGFLRLALMALLSPMGLLIAGVAAVGAVFNVLLQASPKLRNTFGALARILGNLFDPVREGLGKVLESIFPASEAGVSAIASAADFVNDKIRGVLGPLAIWVNTVASPAIERFFDYVAEEVVPAVRSGLGTAASFVTGTVIPALRSFGNYIADTLYPAVADFVSGPVWQTLQDIWDDISAGGVTAWRLMQTAWDGITRVVVGAWHTIQPVIEPLKEGINGIFALFDQPFTLGGLGTALAGLGSGIAGTVGNVGAEIWERLESAFGWVRTRIIEFWESVDWGDVGNTVLGFIETVGFYLGNIASDPRFLTALAAVAAAAVLVAANFAKGVARGIAENIPEIGGLLADALEKAISVGLEQISLENLAGPLTKALIGLAALIGGARLLGAFRNEGRKLGEAVAQGTTQSLTSGGAGFGAGPRSFWSTLFGGGDAAVAAARQNARRVTEAIRSEIGRSNRILASAGRQQISGPVLNAQGLRQSREAIQALTQDLGTGRVAALGVRDALGTIGQGFRSRSLSTIRSGLSDMRTSLQGQARNVGIGLGTAIAGGLGGYFAAGQSGFVQVSTVLSSALMGFAVGGAPVAAATAGLSLVGLAFGSAAQEAQKAKQETQEYLNVLKDIPSDPVEALIPVIRDNFMQELQSTRDLLIEIGFSAREMGEAVIAGTGADSLRSMQRLNELFDKGLISADDYREAVDFLNDEYEESRVAAQAAADGAKIVGDAAKGAGSDVKEATGFLGDFFDFTGNRALIDSIGEVGTEAETAEDAVRDAMSAVQEFFGIDVSSFAQDMNRIFSGLDGLEGQLSNINLGTITGQAQFDEAVTGIVQDFTEAVKDGIEAGEITGVPQINVEVERVKESIYQQLNEDGQITPIEYQFLTTAYAQLDELINDPAALQAAIDAANAAVEFQANPEVVVRPAYTVDDLSALFPDDSPFDLDDLSSLFGDPPEVEYPIIVRPTVSEVNNGGLGDEVREEIRRGSGGQGSQVYGFGGSGAAGGGKGIEVDVPVTVNPSITVGDTKGAGKGIISSLVDSINAGAPIIAGALASAISNGISSAQGASAGAGAAGTRIALAIAQSIAAGGNAVAGAIGVVLARAIATATSTAAAGVSVGRVLTQIIGAGILAGAGFVVGAATSVITRSVAVARAAAGAGVGAGQQLSSSFAAGIAGGSGRAIGAARSMANSAVGALRTGSGAAFSAGANISSSFAAGVRSNAASAISAARAMAAAVIAASRSALQIASPSKVFMNIGREVGRGFAAGIAESKDDLVRTMQDAVSAGIDAAKNTMANARQAGATSLFDELFQSGPGAARRTGVAGISQLDLQFRDYFKGLTNEILDVKRTLDDPARLKAQIEAITAKIGRERNVDAREKLVEERDKLTEDLKEAIKARDDLTPSQRALLTSSRFSLDPRAAIGARNVEELSQGFEKIRDAGAEMLESGISASVVIEEMKRYRSELANSARALGFNSTSINKLITDLGLSDVALNDFLKQIRDLNDEMSRPPPAPPPPPPNGIGVDSSGRYAPTVNANVNIYPQHGDPEAIGLQVLNRLVMQLSTNV